MIYKLPAPRLGIDKVSDNKRKARLRVEGLPVGISHTLGNSLRILLMSSIPGYAPREYLLSETKSKYDSPRGVYQSGTEIEQAVKACRAVPKNKHEGFTLSVNKIVNGDLKLGDFTSDIEVEILNPDHIILNTEEEIRIVMYIRFEHGVGFLKEDYVETNRKLVLDGGKSLVVDADFSPVVFANYKILENYPSVKQETLLIDIETNGVISPEVAMSTASRILSQYGAFLTAFEAVTIRPESISTEGIEPTARELALEKTPIEDLVLSLDSYNSLKDMGIRSLRDLVREKDLITEKIKEEVIRKLDEIGFIVEEIK